MKMAIQWRSSGLTRLLSKALTYVLVALLVLPIQFSTVKAAPGTGGYWENRYSYVVDNGDGSFTTTISEGPRVFWDSEAGAWEDLKFEAVGGGYMIENSMITAYVYEWYTVYWDPDNKRVAVDDERWIVQVYDPKKDSWGEVDLYGPTLSYSNNATHLTVTRTFDNPDGLLTVSYILPRGGRLKHDVRFVSRVSGDNVYRVVMKLSGIASDKVNNAVVSQETHLIVPVLVFGDPGSPVFSEYLWDLGEVNESDYWTPDKLADIVVDTHAKGSKMDVIIGNYTLAQGEGLIIDPDSDTFYVEHGDDDAHERGDGPFDFSGNSVKVYGANVITSSSYYAGGFRFQNVTIPQGSNVTAANVSVRISNPDDMYCDIYGNDVDDADDFNTDQDIVGRDRTTASLAWVANGLGVGFETKTGLEGVVSEIVNRGSWASGNDLALLFIARTPDFTQCLIYSYDRGSQYAAYLGVTWTPPAPGVVYNRTATQSLSFSWDVYRTWTLSRALSQSLSTTFNVYRGWTLSRALDQTLSMSFDVYRTITITRVVSQSMTFVFNAYSTLTGPIINVLIRIITGLGVGIQGVNVSIPPHFNSLTNATGWINETMTTGNYTLSVDYGSDYIPYDHDYSFMDNFNWVIKLLTVGEGEEAIPFNMELLIFSAISALATAGAFLGAPILGTVAGALGLFMWSFTAQWFMYQQAGAPTTSFGYVFYLLAVISLLLAVKNSLEIYNQMTRKGGY